ncbi:hypothetical protein EBB07_01050 [Paenibacillaceae bacterium]|nr:hypothetical protein EBB07_01050 [Paenibacillaceae bacterium]
MMNYRAIRRAVLTGAVAVPLIVATSGCGVFSSKTSKEIDPPPVQSSWVNQTSGESEAMTQDGQEQVSKMTVYMQDTNGYVVPVTMSAKLADGADAQKLALQMLVKDGPYSAQLPAGFEGVLPEGTEVIVLKVVENVAMLDLSEAFTSYNASDERNMLEAITWTLTGFPEIDQVELWHEGEKLKEMPVNGFPLDNPLTRAMGINLEKAEGVQYSRSMPVTVYYSAITPDDEQYYVPVTRLIDRKDDIATAAVAELIAGPTPFSDLNSVMTQDIVVDAVTVQEGTATVDLTDASHQDGQQTPAELVQAVILSVTENTGADKVLIRLNGKADVTDTNNQSYSEPVARPEDVNALKS